MACGVPQATAPEQAVHLEFVLMVCLPPSLFDLGEHLLKTNWLGCTCYHLLISGHTIVRSEEFLQIAHRIPFLALHCFGHDFDPSNGLRLSGSLAFPDILCRHYCNLVDGYKTSAPTPAPLLHSL